MKPSLNITTGNSESGAVGGVSASLVHPCVHNVHICLEMMWSREAVHVHDSSWAPASPPLYPLFPNSVCFTMPRSVRSSNML